MTWLIFILGAMVAGFVQGLTGFAFALIAMSFWVWILAPQLAAPLVVFASVWSHLISLKSESAFQLDKSLVAPYILAGLIGVPLGTYLLDIIQAQTFKLILGIFLILWCPLMLINPQIRFIQNSGKYADSSIGFLGGVLGGVGGFCGSLPSAWVMLKNLPKEQQRSILRHFNFAMLIAFYIGLGFLFAAGKHLFMITGHTAVVCLIVLYILTVKRLEKFFSLFYFFG